MHNDDGEQREPASLPEVIGNAGVKEAEENYPYLSSGFVRYWDGFLPRAAAVSCFAPRIGMYVLRYNFILSVGCSLWTSRCY